MKKRILTLVIFGVLLASLLFASYRVLSFKYIDGIRQGESLSSQDKDSIDVLCVGSSHCFADLDPGEMYQRAGIAAFDLSASEQPFWNSYYDIVTALRTQSPKVILLEGYAAIDVPVDSESSRVIKNTFGIQNRSDREAAIRASAPKEDVGDYLLSYRWWHSRYRDLSEDDFYRRDDNEIKAFKGGTLSSLTEAQEMPPVDSWPEEPMPLSEKQETYFRKIAELCRDREIPLMVVVAPYILTESDQRHFAALGEICAEYEVPFINFNSEEWYRKLDLDFATDFAEKSHLNFRGNRKFTDLVTDLLVDSGIELPDRRGDSAYASWETYAERMAEERRVYDFRETEKISEFREELAENPNYRIYLATYSDTARIAGTGIYDGLVSGEFIPADGAVYEIAGGEAALRGGGSCTVCENLNHRTLSISRKLDPDSGEAVSQWIFYDGSDFLNDASGNYLVIYDDKIQDLAAVFQLKADPGTGEIRLIRKKKLS